MTCECTLCRDDREAAAHWQAKALELRAEADDYDARAARTLDRVNSYPSKPEPPHSDVP